MYHTARKIRCRWECSVPRGVPFSRDQDSLATAGGTLPPLGGSLPSTAGRAPSLRRSTSLPLRSRASPLALCVHARGQLGWRLSLFGWRQWPKRFDEFSVRHAALNPSYTRRRTSWRSRLRFPAPRHFVITWHNAIWGCPLFRSVLL